LGFKIYIQKKIGLKGYLKHFLVLFVSLILGSCQVNKNLKDGDYLVEKNQFKFNGTNIDHAELESYLRQKPNRKILKAVPFNLWLYFQIDQKKMLSYKAKRNLKFDRINQKRIAKNTKKNEARIAKGKKTKEPKLKNKEKLTLRESLLDAGEAPVILDYALNKITTSQLQKFVFSRGYFNSVVKDTVMLFKKRAVTNYYISKSVPYLINDISYKIDDPFIEQFIITDTIHSLIRKNSVYNEDLFQKERERITDRLLNNGYFYFAPEYIHFIVDSNLAGNLINLKLELRKFSQSMSESNDSLIYLNHPKFSLKNIYIIPETVTDFRGNSSNIYMKDTAYYNGFKVLHNKKLQFRLNDLTRDISLAEGQLYQKDLAEESYKGISALKVFKSVFLQFVKNASYEDKLDCYIVCQPLVKQSITIESEGTNTSGNLGIAGSLVFQNKNTFKGAELVELKLNGSLTAQKQFNTTQTTDIKNVTSTFNTIQFGPQLNIYFPKPLFPFTLFYYKKNHNEKRYFVQPRTILNLSINYQERPEFARTISSISYGFKFNNSKGLFTYEVVPVETYLVKAKLFGTFRDELLNLKDFFLLNSFQDHLTTLSRISAIFNNQNVARKRNVMYLKMNLSSSGNFLRGAYNITNQPKDTLGRYQILNIPFSQFVKIDVDYRFYFKTWKTDKLVYRIAGGIGKPLNNLSSLPYEQSFFGGGPNTMRAWRARTLGPGSYKSLTSDAKYDKIGNIQIETNIEYRFHIFKSFYGTWFADAGNIWLLKPDESKPGGEFKVDNFYKEFGLGSGFGIRYDFGFFVLRFDGAIKVIDPENELRKRFVLGKKTMRESSILNFGIGYPF
jgi:outer membrane protein assembly factor BamA